MRWTSTIVKWWRTVGQRKRWGLASLGVALLAVLVWLVWPQEPEPRARQYLDFTACLLTDDNGLTGPQARPVWAGMQRASLATHAKVEYLVVRGPQTVDNASTFLTSLAQGQCHLLFAVGKAPTGSVAANATKFPRTRFVVVGGNPVESRDNLVILKERSSDAVTSAVDDLITDAVEEFD